MKQYIAFFLIISVQFFWGGADTACAESYFEGQVDKVIDGDTILLRGGTIIQYMGIDTPEARSMQPLFSEIANKALALNQQLVEKKRVRLELVEGVSTTETSRKYAYVFVGGQMVNAVMLKKGYAIISATYPPDEKYETYFSQCQEEACSGQLGLWKTLSTKSTKKGSASYAFQ